MTADRFNEGKIDLTLIPTAAQREEALVWMNGEKKYGRSNWKKLWGDKTVETVMASLLRHANAILDGEVNDSESGLMHAGHIRCNAAMLIEYFSRLDQDTPAPTSKFYVVLLPYVVETTDGYEYTCWNSKIIREDELTYYESNYPGMRIKEEYHDDN